MHVYVLGFMGYGLILGMDWLIMYGSILDCEKRVVRFLTCHGRTLEISCDPQGSVMLSFLESLDASIDDLQSVPVVQDYSNVFDEVWGLLQGTRSIFVYILGTMQSQLHYQCATWLQWKGGS